MLSKQSTISRKRFIKGVAGLAAVPWISGINLPGPGKNKRNRKGLHNVLSCNIRVALAEDEDRGSGWSHRKALTVDVVRAQQPDIICMQEVLASQDRDMREAFPGFFSFGFDGPEMDAQPPDGYHGIAKNTILFSKERYEWISAGCYWLSETPHIGGSKSWDTARARHVNWVRLRERDSETHFRVLNTHLDHVKQSAREKQIAMILEESGQYPSGFRQILAGDFNQDASNRVIEKIKEHGWTDTYASAHGEAYSGFTYHGFHGKRFPETRQGDIKGQIDFIFSKGAVKASHANIIKDNKDGFYPSDHYFIAADIVFSKSY